MKKYEDEKYLDMTQEEEANILSLAKSNLSLLAIIDALKSTLNESDYKIIKAAEYQLAGGSMPYDIKQLHASRQALRDEINRMEAEL